MSSSISSVANPRWFHPLLGILLAALAFLQIHSIVEESQAWDEAIHLAAGYSYLKTGRYEINTEHPPLPKLLNALPLLWWNPDPKMSGPYWDGRDQVMFGADFLYNNTVPHETLLLAGRSVTILLTLVLVVALALWTRRRYGPVAALLAAAAVAFDPNIIAHGRYITSDLAATLLFFAVCAAWIDFLTGPGVVRLLRAALLLGIALTVKFSLVVLFPVMALLWGGHAIAARRLDLGRNAAAFAFAAAWAAVTVQAVYGSGGWETAKTGGDLGWMENPACQTLGRVAARHDVRIHPFLYGLCEVIEHDRGGHQTYLLGQISEAGWRHYFPVAFAVKTPVGTLLLVSLAVVLGAVRWRGIGFAATGLALAAVAYFAVSMTSHLNLGLRHILPVYPALAVAAASVVSRAGWRGRAAGSLAVALVAAEAGAVHPYHLSFFNWLAGGPEAGTRYLLDSNIDWGQDLKRLSRYIADHDLDPVGILYFGTASFHHNGIRAHVLDVPNSSAAVAIAELDCVVAASVTPLFGAYVGEGTFRWLRELKPVGRIGYSIWLYDFRKPSAASATDSAEPGQSPAR